MIHIPKKLEKIKMNIKENESLCVDLEINFSLCTQQRLDEMT